MELEENLSALQALGVNAAGMTYDDRTSLAAFHAEQDLGYPLLQDVDARHALAYGVLNEQYSPGDRNYGIPHPGILFISPEGIVVAKFAAPGYRKRPPMEEVVEAVAALVNR